MNWQMGYWILFANCWMNIACVIVVVLSFRRQGRLTDHMLKNWMPKPSYIDGLLEHEEPSR